MIGASTVILYSNFSNNSDAKYYKNTLAADYTHMRMRKPQLARWMRYNSVKCNINSGHSVSEYTPCNITL